MQKTKNSKTDLTKRNPIAKELKEYVPKVIPNKKRKLLNKLFNKEEDD